MNNQLTPEQRAAKYTTAAKIVGFLIVAFFVAPVIVVTIKGAIGLLAALAGGAVVYSLFPAFGKWLANIKLKAIKAEAARHPVEQLENELGRRQDALETARANIKKFDGIVQSFADLCEENQDKCSPAQRQRNETQLGKMQQLLKLQNAKYVRAGQDVQKFSIAVDQFRADYNMALAAAAANQASRDAVGQSFLDKISTDTAITTIKDTMNTSFAELDTTLLDEQIAAVTNPIRPDENTTATTRKLDA